jgi:hypothetical protein
MDATTAIAIAGLVTTLLAALGGTWLGQALESHRESHQRKMLAYQDYTALILESATGIRSAARDATIGRDLGLRAGFGREYFRAIALLKLIAPSVVNERMAIVGDRVSELAHLIEKDPGADMTGGDVAIMDALQAFHQAATRDLLPWWRKLRA